jgi:hypothetical protein
MRPKQLGLREAMIHCGEMWRNSEKPKIYYWHAMWWRLSSKESKNPSEAIGYARNLMTLYKDMQRRPKHYADPLRPKWISDWVWSDLKLNAHASTLSPGAPDAQTDA